MQDVDCISSLEPCGTSPHPFRKEILLLSGACFVCANATWYVCAFGHVQLSPVETPLQRYDTFRLRSWCTTLETRPIS